LNLSFEQWNSLFIPKEHLTYKIKVGKKENLIANEYVGIIEKPSDIQDKVDLLIKEY